MLAVGGDAPYFNEKSANLTSCLRVGFVLFRPLAIRGVISAGHSRRDTPGSQKARSAIRCIKTPYCPSHHTWQRGQKARSAIRCIKTPVAKPRRNNAVTPSESTERHKVH